MRAWRLTAGLASGIAATSLVLYACGTDESGTCSDTLTCAGDDGGVGAETGDDGTVVTDGGTDAHHDGSADGGDAMTISDGNAADTTADSADGFTCDPTQGPMTEPCVVAEAYGIFVATGGSATAAGTKAAPVNSIAVALTLAQSGSKHLIFVCGGAYAGAVTIASTLSLDVAIYGGMSCPSAVGGVDGGTTWAYTGAATSVSSGSNTPALTVSGTTHAVKIEDVAFSAIDAVNAGDSSIAGWIANASGVALKRVAFHSGSCVAQGVAGTPPENHFAGTLTGNGLADAGARAGALEQDCTCVDQTTSFGGGGGNGATGGGGDGTSGGSNPTAAAMPPDTGHFGSGAVGLMTCGNGFAGANGSGGGAGAGATTLGVLTASSWTPSAGAHGGNGNPGQGGGGGGGTLGALAVGGGGGGCGGCGGGAGQGGAGGGSSFALVVVSSTVTITSSTFAAGNGGNGGQGSQGEDGQQGGNGGGTPPSCGGGGGGAGAGGGGGGGGAGGSSVGIAWTGAGTALSIDGAAVSADIATASYFTGGTVGLAGVLGAGGLQAPGGAAGTQGDPGIAGALDAVKQF